MGISTDALIAYGVDLGDRFFDSYDEEYEELGVIDTIQDKLLAAKGFTETDWQVEGYWERKHKAIADLGVGLITYSSYEEPYYILGTKSHTCWRGDTVPISPEDLVVQDDWNTSIEWALNVLGIEANSPPQWYLSVVWG